MLLILAAESNVFYLTDGAVFFTQNQAKNHSLTTSDAELNLYAIDGSTAIYFTFYRYFKLMQNEVMKLLF